MIKKIFLVLFLLVCSSFVYAQLNLDNNKFIVSENNKQDKFVIAHDDLYGQFTNAIGVSALGTINIRDTGFPILCFQNANDDTCYNSYQMSHKKALGTNIDGVHIHAYLPSKPNAGNTVIFDYAFYFSTNTSTIPALTGWTVGRSTYTFTGNEQQYQNIMIPIISSSTITVPSTEGYSSQLFVKITRDSTGGTADTYNDDLGIYNYPDCHIEQNRLGSYNEASD